MTKFLLHLTERGYISDFLIKKAALFLSNRRLAESDIEKNKEKVINLLSDGVVAEKTVDANDQHYEVPPEFFKKVLGQRLKYSCSLFDGQITLDEAEDKMLNLYIERANILNGQEILDLGCGWGSFSLYAAAKFPESNITSVSNSSDQINFINEEAEKRNLKNIKAIKMDVNNLNLDIHFDRIISIEMFEHLRNFAEPTALSYDQKQEMIDLAVTFIRKLDWQDYNEAVTRKALNTLVSYGRSTSCAWFCKRGLCPAPCWRDDGTRREY